MKKIIVSLFALFFAVIMLYSAYRLWEIYSVYRDEARLHGQVMEYKPQPAEEEEIINQSVIDLQGKYPDIMGWLTIKNTDVDYPFVWYKDNDFYLRRDLDGKHAMAGTIFMDFRCEKDFTSQNTIIYGHNMRNGSMFGTLNRFNDQTFFDENRRGMIFLPYENIQLEFFAFVVVNPTTEREIYNIALSEGYWDYVKQKARYFRDIEFTDGDRLVTLSTCSYEFNNARMVLVGKVI